MSSAAKAYAGAFPHPNGDSLSPEPYLLVKNNAGNIALAGIGEESIGLTARKVQSTDEIASVEPLIPGCVYRVTASAAFSAQADLFAAASGKVSSTPSGRKLFRAFEAASGDGSQVLAQYLPGGESGLVSQEVTFTEDGDTTYTGTVNVPAGATIVNIIVNAVTLWDDGTSAALIVGDETDDNGFFDAVNLKATDLLAEQSIDFAKTGGKEGAYLVGTATHWTDRYRAAARTVVGKVTTGGQDGSAGETRMTVIYSLPETVIAATGA